jgi:hypothetical protein
MTSQTYDLLIKGGRAVLPGGTLACDVAVKDGRIAELGEVVHRGPVLVCGVDVEETQLVRPGRIVELRLFHRVACVPQVEEVFALDHAAVGHVEAGDDAGLQHGGRLDDRTVGGKASVVVRVWGKMKVPELHFAKAASASFRSSAPS